VQIIYLACAKPADVLYMNPHINIRISYIFPACIRQLTVKIQYLVKNMTVKTKCPVCGGEVSLPDDVMAGEVVEHDCGVTLEVVIDNNIVKVKPLEGVGEDWGE